MTTTLDRRSSEQSRLRRIKAPTLVAGAVVGASLLLHLRDPHESGSWGFCPWLLLTGTYCPGCGGLRAVNDLTRGDIPAAASSNLLFVGAVPLLVFFWGRWFNDRWNGVRREVSSRKALSYAVAVLAVAIAFAVVRNTPWGAWLAP
ncbi:MAG TPA: DUF2752 domain-containing protein [Nocardioidaceae bacterium]|nr:DUF2752 domain-containing protein [Nocardioidaceae bacterium]